ncbi:MAG: hypothetical protein ACM3UP_00200 [Methanocella sp.]
MRILLLILAVFAAAVALFAFVVRPWYNGWGATQAAQAQSLPGDDLVPEPRLTSTRSVIIHAPADKVWPWLIQLGYGKAGWYNHDWINCGLFGARYYEGRHSSSHILPQFQNLKVGDIVPLGPDSGWEVIRLEPNRLMVLTAWVDLKSGRSVKAGDPEPAQSYIHSSEVYLLEELDANTTRFTVRDRLDFEMGGANIVGYVMEPGYFIQESAFMKGVKKRAEALYRTS